MDYYIGGVAPSVFAALAWLLYDFGDKKVEEATFHIRMSKKEEEIYKKLIEDLEKNMGFKKTK